jgi:hypothetical protein
MEDQNKERISWVSQSQSRSAEDILRDKAVEKGMIREIEEGRLKRTSSRSTL